MNLSFDAPWNQSLWKSCNTSTAILSRLSSFSSSLVSSELRNVGCSSDEVVQNGLQSPNAGYASSVTHYVTPTENNPLFSVYFKATAAAVFLTNRKMEQSHKNEQEVNERNERFQGKNFSFSLSNLAFIPLMNSFEFLSPYRIHLRDAHSAQSVKILLLVFFRLARSSQRQMTQRARPRNTYFIS